MVRFRKKISAFVVTAVLVGGILPVWGMRPAPAEQQKALPARSASLSVNEEDFGAPGAGKFQNSELFYKMTLSVLLVIGLGAAAIYLTKRVLPKITGGPSKEIHILETAHIGQRRAVHLVKAGDRMLLIGSTNGSITKLADLTKASSSGPKQWEDNV